MPSTARLLFPFSLILFLFLDSCMSRNGYLGVKGEDNKDQQETTPEEPQSKEVQRDILNPSVDVTLLLKTAPFSGNIDLDKDKKTIPLDDALFYLKKILNKTLVFTMIRAGNLLTLMKVGNVVLDDSFVEKTFETTLASLDDEIAQLSQLYHKNLSDEKKYKLKNIEKKSKRLKKLLEKNIKKLAFYKKYALNNRKDAKRGILSMIKATRITIFKTGFLVISLRDATKDAIALRKAIQEFYSSPHHDCLPAL